MKKLFFVFVCIFAISLNSYSETLEVRRIEQLETMKQADELKQKIEITLELLQESNKKIKHLERKLTFYRILPFAATFLIIVCIIIMAIFLITKNKRIFK